MIAADNRRRVAVEVELTVKNFKSMKVVLDNYVSELGDIDDSMAPFHQVIYFTPYPKAVQALIDRLVPDDFRDHFLVRQLDLCIKPFVSADLFFLDDDLRNFLDRGCGGDRDGDA